MTRVSVYSAALVAFVAAAAMIVASIAMPNWIDYAVTTAKGDTVRKTIGLHRSCSNLDGPRCVPYPTAALCQSAERRYFCTVWRTTGWLASFSVVLGLAGLLSLAVTLAGGKYRRESGWPLVSGLVATFAAVQLIVVSVVAYLFDHDEQFAIPGWQLGASWYLALSSALLCVTTVAGLVLSAYVLQPEDGYEFLEDPTNA
ncbi:hypothetical protein ISF_06960 [Cordyceps fumosorosea ARSEF 2679]|uniref:Pre-mRNA splicing factor n=1 Tax=Cordyceps fumosorosea (strain ARSEF 2679) TaxID=1081104 RepID=A0A167QKB1_CORFA|nr:hypothetical protein ISF_06960 [Cordyceps fumosorosea ARSEF 2679]OAA57719.1 hypothetical protein ISF_06960 [Cordyceps fumosorosea ARSEF 2679]